MAENPFEKFWNLGFKRLVPIIPPGIEISANSSLFKRVGTKSDGRGKTPGLKGSDGTWYGYDWVPYEANEHDLRRYHVMGAGVGIKTGLQPDGRTLVAIDADTLNADHAKTILNAIADQLGALPVRVGNYPKAAYLCLIDGPFQYTRIEFGTERVEVLSDGRQFVAEGIHNKTGKPYTWPKGIPHYDALPVFRAEQITQLLETLRQHLPAATPLITEGAQTDISQASLRGELDTVRRAVAATPNTHNTFPSRESYRDFGYGIKAALPDHPDEAFEIFAQWCEGWTGPRGDINEPDVIEADWRRMRPPFRRGASWLYSLAEEYSGGEFTQADAFFAPVSDEPENPFAVVAEREQRDKAGDVYPMLSLAEIMDRQPPVFLIGRHIPQTSVGFLYSTPGAGKSFLALDIALSIAYGLETWHGDNLTTDLEAVVLYIAAEGSFGFRNRARAWRQARGLDGLPKRFLMIERTIDFMSADDIDKLLRTVRAVTGLRICLIIVDTVSRAMPGADENLQKEMTLFVKACDRLKEAFSCAVLGVHHAGKNGDMRGSTVLLGAGDFVFKLERKQGATVGRLTCEKQKDAPDGWTEPYRFEQVDIGDGQSSLVPSRAEISIGPDIEVTAGLSKSILEAMAAAWAAGTPWGKTYHARDRQASRVLVRDFGLEAEKADEILTLWEQMGVIVEDIVSKKSKRKGLRVADPIDDTGPDEGSVFD